MEGCINSILGGFYSMNKTLKIIVLNQVFFELNL